MTRIDWYIIKKFLGTFFYAILLLLSVCIIFDLSEKIDDFIDKEAPFREVIYDYYLNFIPYFANLFSGLFTFIAVIYFTSKMAFNSEIIAIQSSGMSFARLLLPYMISATVIFGISFTLAHWIIPPANESMFEFKWKYIDKPKQREYNHVHRQVQPNVYIYLNKYRRSSDSGEKFSIEKFEDGKLVSKLNADYIRWDRERKVWEITDYVIRNFHEDGETFEVGARTDTVINMRPEDFKADAETIEIMDYNELTNFIQKQRMRGVDSIEVYQIEHHRRFAVPFSAFILSLIGASLASRKIRGGIGLHLGFGLGLSFTYIMFQQVSKVFALSGAVTPMVAMWIPNIIYMIIGYFLYRWAARV